jgi:hypothetical protein
VNPARIRPAAPDRLRAAEPPAPAPAPLKVIIGRIEVRPLAPAAARDSKAAGPKLTLDAYLRQRRGGGS